MDTEKNKETIETTKIPTPLRNAARAGMFLGLFFALKYLLFINAFSYPILALVFFIATLSVPFLAYSITKAYRDLYFQGQTFKFRVAWVHGTWLYLFASIVLLIPVYYFYTRALPDSIPLIEQSLNELYTQAPNLKVQLVEGLGSDPISLLKESTSSEYILPNLLACLNRNFIAGALLSLINAAILQRK